MVEEDRSQCKHCGIDLPISHTGPCPKCGKTGKIIEISGHMSARGKLSAKLTHKPKWSSESLALFFGFVAVFLAIVISGILNLLPFSLGINYAILIGFLLIAGCIFWWQRYHILMLIRKLESKFGGEG